MDDRSTAISAAEVADDRAEIAAAVKVAKAFRDKLEAAGISYHKLLALEEARRDMNDLAHQQFHHHPADKDLGKRDHKGDRNRDRRPRRDRAGLGRGGHPVHDQKRGAIGTNRL